MKTETKSIHQHVDWYVSYMTGDEQGIAMIKALQAKIKQYGNLFEAIIGELELVSDPKEISPIQALDSVKSMIDGIPEISVQKGCFVWRG